jgi:hypothetical protein
MVLSRARNFVIVLSLLSVAATTCWGQAGTTSLRGVVVDKSQATVAGAKVDLENHSQGFERKTTTSLSGEFEFLALPPGTYTLVVEKNGFKRYQRSELQLLVGVPTSISTELEIGSATERIEVSSTAETINITDASLGNAFDENQVKELPLESRNVPDLLSLQTGVVYTGNNPNIDANQDTRNGAINGARSDQSNITVDGVSVNSRGGYAFTSVLPVTPDSIQEFRVTTTNYGADEGVSSAAQVALVTKSGTNHFHGSVYEYNRNSYFSANDYFIKTAQLQSGSPNAPPKLNRNIFGASLGGPIVKNRLYFFTNFEGYRDAEAVSAVRTVPTAAFRDGVIQYECISVSVCPGNTVQGISGKSYTAPAGYFALSPQEITQMDSTSLGAHGPNPVVLNYMNSTYLLPNDSTVGDGVNTAGYRFRAPTDTTKNWYIAKLDYNITSDGKHRLSISGALANENSAQPPFLPGAPPSTDIVNYNKGIIVGYSSVLSSSLINNLRYGYIRESVGTIGDSTQSWNYFIGIDQGITRSSSFQRPVNNLTDDVAWIHGKHTWQFGFQFSFLRNPESNDNGSFNAGVFEPSWMVDGGLSGAANPSPLNPSNPANGFPGVNPTFSGDYDNAMTGLLGMVTYANANYNYTRSGSSLPEGAPVTRRFAEDAYEIYAQDVWKLNPNLTVTLGLRYSLFSPPWETNGLQVIPTINLGKWFNDRGQGMLQGLPSNAQPLVTYELGGPVNGKPSYYNWDFGNLGPRIALAWSPDHSSGLLGNLFGGKGKSSIRAGFGIVYDRVGESLVDTFDEAGSFGLSTSLSNQANSLSSIDAPRITSMNVVPTSSAAGNPILPLAPSGSFPQTYPVGTGAITWGVDQGLKTPYSYTLDLAVSRELGSGFTFDVAYVGRLSHRLLAQDDLAMPLDIYDKASGIDYFTAETALAKIYRPELNSGNSSPTLSFNPNQLPANVQQFWEDQIQPLAPGGAYTLGGCTGGKTLGTTNPTIFAFDVFCGSGANDTLALYNLDYNGIPDFNDPSRRYFTSGGQYSYYDSQYGSLFAWRSVGWSNYNALQVTVRHKMVRGLQFDLNYTFSKSIDIASDAERVTPESFGGYQGLNKAIVNAWNPDQMKAVSAFDATHQFNANWLWQLPIGRGKWLVHDSNRALDALIGGWQLTGLFRITSGFPLSVDNSLNYWPTNFQAEGTATQIAPVQTGVYNNSGTPNMFANGPATINSFMPTYAGQSGQRNQLRGDGYFGVDMGLAKRWNMPWREQQSLQFRWEVFNVTNSVRFDVVSSQLSGNLGLASGASFGNYNQTLTNPRIMQFALRYEF